MKQIWILGNFGYLFDSSVVTIDDTDNDLFFARLDNKYLTYVSAVFIISNIWK